MKLIRIDVPVVPKARPNVGRHGVWYPQRYVEFRESVVQAVTESRITPRIEMPPAVGLRLEIDADGFSFQLVPGDPRPKWVRGDIDNLCGGVMDALVDAEVLPDDRIVTHLDGKLITKEERDNG